MNTSSTLAQIGIRYSALAEQSCCLSCGGAIDRAEVQPGEVCVDLGSGRGQDVLRLAERAGPSGFAYGIDTAPGMLEKARRTAEKLGISNAAFVASSFEGLPLQDETADLVISNCAINHANDKDAVWREVFRILRPGGRFVVSDIYAIEDVPELYRNDPVAVAECWAGAVRKEVYLGSLAGAGFVEVHILEESEPYAKGRIEVASFTIAGRKAHL